MDKEKWRRSTKHATTERRWRGQASWNRFERRAARAQGKQTMQRYRPDPVSEVRLVGSGINAEGEPIAVHEEHDTIVDALASLREWQRFAELAGQPERVPVLRESR